MTVIKRSPIIVTPDSSVKIDLTIKTQGGGDVWDKVLFYSINNEPFIIDTMQSAMGDTLYRTIIPAQPLGTFVKYFIKFSHPSGASIIYANSATDKWWSLDTSKGFYFYKVTDGNLTIQDVQYTPYINGRSSYVGAVTTLRGIVTADTSDLALTSPSGSSGAIVWYIQSGNSSASGIWITGILDTLKRLKRGDSVAVTGTIQEKFDVTRLGNVSAVQWCTSNNSLPAPVKLTTGVFGISVGNGDLNAEPYEGMLVEFDTVTVTDIEPVYANPWEYNVSDGTGSMIILRGGRNTYSPFPGDTVYGYTIIKVGDKFTKLRGLVFYSFNRYKIVPRTNADFGIYTPVSVTDESSFKIPDNYYLSDNYPNPFNPSTIIEYSIPREDFVVLKVYNVMGQEVTTLKNEIQKAGQYKVHFDGSKLSSGIYFYRLQTSSYNEVKKMLLLR